MQNGFYWVICHDSDNEEQVAEYSDGKWFLTGVERAYCDDDVEVIRGVETPTNLWRV